MPGKRLELQAAKLSPCHHLPTLAARSLPHPGWRSCRSSCSSRDFATSATANPSPQPGTGPRSCSLGVAAMFNSNNNNNYNKNNNNNNNNNNN
eukprot:CAMPEP_0115058314 /NCGR_PEP_ID=MMETSP0227-20121206/6277_1 /TAXON_ID=89957 /ORGANISM="Polarella glacialis, Strain CCMP 1383" /LENGTH=92 /DNA_ID=CAMNT_0002443279 /DNA_START=426 /DNA_END=701 /DNA_ORIENTATION=-